ncbi:GNAT family N-acetyltransferase [Bacillus sp. EB01]|uniref:GNAT family N-acetyltransferase n=1 Tax=Bacillus sp. EB01 TaxID=1347086 RepID=UPI0005C4C41B|nr:GNAT family N-acetyltransferase [Bacillus sp. EB01]
MIVYRRFAVSDIVGLEELINENSEFFSKGSKTNVEQLNEWFNDPEEDIKENTFVSLAEGKIIGYQALCLLKRPEKLNVYAYGQVHHAWRRKGVGSELIRQSLKSLTHLKKEFPNVIYNHLVRVPSGQEYELAEKFNYQILTRLNNYYMDIKKADSPRLPAEFTFSPFRKEFASTLASLYNTAFSWHPNTSGLTAKGILYEMNNRDFEAEFNIACLNLLGKAIGYISGHREGENAGVISTIAVNTDSQGKGIGKALLQELILRMKLAGVKTIRLTVDACNPTGAIPLYQKHGFKIGETIIHYTVEI